MSVMNEAFEAFYQDIWQERWPSLKESLLVEKNYDGLYAYCDEEREASPYYLDRVSRWVAEHLQVREGERVLDMCAAPGGKGMVLLNALKGTGFYWGNDKERYARLSRVMRPIYPSDTFKLTSYDGKVMGIKSSEVFDAILVDAPCSSEWHWLKDASLLQHWRVTRPKRLAIDQYALLASALMMLPPGGRVLYVTCAINPLENQGVIKKALKRWNGKITVDSAIPSFAEDAGIGFYCLPDKGYGGPLYACLIHRNEQG